MGDFKLTTVEELNKNEYFFRKKLIRYRNPKDYITKKNQKLKEFSSFACLI